ncbi:putative spermidine/putrescine transport system permease protein [Inquilinus ginsengisoli]|uniref:Spermidine/putrescine transport system permease protein n=1 Tax=Inquilinus ginsengisoli TaxID=363840 RepID=A0ABU1JLM5_9PROT|nr:ABC transporter permease [Inquilinus ginsengisoli]MDR6289518.1 putative spermidine/putrescine transport system permease protein [Inquilinus ginsengisoli]
MGRLLESLRLWRALLWLVGGAGLLFLIAPILAIIPLAFNGGSFLTYPLDGFSLRWFEEFFTSDRWMGALANSLVIGSATTALATVLGTLAALGLNHAPLRFRGLLTGLLLSPMIVPVVIVAVGLYFAFAAVGLTNSYAGLILAHTALASPFVVITVGATLQSLDLNLPRAASSLGAKPTTTFFRVTLPLILPGVVSGALFAFVTSFDEVVVALLLAGPGQRTLPREMFNGIRESITPTITAAATILIVVSTLMLIAIEALRRRSERLRARR